MKTMRYKRCIAAIATAALAASVVAVAPSAVAATPTSPTMTIVDSQSGDTLTVANDGD
jgi:hypothetical protein